MTTATLNPCMSLRDLMQLTSPSPTSSTSSPATDPRRTACCFDERRWVADRRSPPCRRVQLNNHPGRADRTDRPPVVPPPTTPSRSDPVCIATEGPRPIDEATLRAMEQPT